MTTPAELRELAVAYGKFFEHHEVIDEDVHESQFVAEANQAEKTGWVEHGASDVLGVLLGHYQTAEFVVPHHNGAVQSAEGHEVRLPGAG